MRPLLAACLLALGAPAAALAQAGPAPATPPATPTFLSRSAFLVGFAHLTSDDPRFVWDARVSADVDVLDYGRGRINFWGTYEGLLGSERRLLDLNHENFVVEGSASYRIQASELSLAFHHVSRHLSDRANPDVVAWNTLTFRAAHTMTARGTRYHGFLEASRVLQHTYVDYAWTSLLQVDLERPINARTSFVAIGTGQLVGIDPSRSTRDRQCGARAEAGIQFSGRTGAVEFYVAYERRIDAYPLARQRARWFEVGFKLMG
jgi:hypothetical protein